jgi:hypothetical protein
VQHATDLREIEDTRGVCLVERPLDASVRDHRTEVEQRARDRRDRQTVDLVDVRIG